MADDTYDLHARVKVLEHRADKQEELADARHKESLTAIRETSTEVGSIRNEFSGKLDQINSTLQASALSSAKDQGGREWRKDAAKTAGIIAAAIIGGCGLTWLGPSLHALFFG